MKSELVIILIFLGPKQFLNFICRSLYVIKGLDLFALMGIHLPEIGSWLFNPSNHQKRPVPYFFNTLQPCSNGLCLSVRVYSFTVGFIKFMSLYNLCRLQISLERLEHHVAQLGQMPQDFCYKFNRMYWLINIKENIFVGTIVQIFLCRITF